MQFVHFILALAPIIWLIVALSVLKMPGYKACLITVTITAIEALIIWHFKPLYLVTAALEGALNALWPICLVIVAALFTYNLSLALLIAWAFGHFMEGMAGFGTAVAIPAGILIALGMEPLPVVVGCLVVNSLPTAFGSVGVPTTTVSNITGLDVVKLSADTAKIEVLMFCILPFLLIFIVGNGFKAFKGMIGMIIVAAVSFIVPMFVFATFVGPELPDIIGAICSMVCIILFARMPQGCRHRMGPVPADLCAACTYQPCTVYQAAALSDQEQLSHLCRKSGVQADIYLDQYAGRHHHYFSGDRRTHPGSFSCHALECICKDC